MNTVFFSNDYGPWSSDVETSWNYKMEQENLKRETLNTFLVEKLDEMAEIVNQYETNYDPVL